MHVHYSGDLADVKTRLQVVEGSKRDVIVPSGYFSYDLKDEPPPKKVQELIDFCRKKDCLLF